MNTSIHGNPSLPQEATTVRAAVDHERLARLDDLYAEAIAERNPLRANLRAATADLLEISYMLGDAIKASLASRSAALQAHEKLLPAIGLFALLHRQATRYVQIEQEQEEARTGRQAQRAKKRRIDTENDPRKRE